jgi:WD40 repeat protein
MEPCVRLWDVRTGKERFEESGHCGAIASLAFTPDGRTLISGSWDGRLRVWDVASGRTRRALTDHRGRVHTVLVTPDGKTVLSAGLDHRLRLHDLATGEERHFCLDQPEKEPHEPGYQFVSLGLAPDGRTLATWSTRREDGVFHVWDLATGQARLSRPVASPLRRCWFCPDARFVLSCNPAPMPEGGGASVVSVDETGTPAWMPLDPSSLELQDVRTGRRVLALPQPDVFQSVQAFTPDGRMLVTATGQVRGSERVPSCKHALHLWELASGKERLTITPGHTGGEYRFEHIAVAPAGGLVATVRADGTIQLWDTAAGAELLCRRANGAPVVCLAFSPDSRVLATGHADSTILLWDMTIGSRALRGPAEEPDARELERWWADLASDDARTAYAAIRVMSAAPEEALPLLRDRLRPAAVVPADQLRGLIAELDSDAFPRRQAASARLAALGEQAHAALQAARKGSPSVELRRGIDALLADSCRVRSSEVLRSLRGVEVLESIGGAGACRVVEALAAGAPDARLTREAQAALARMQKR